MKVFAASRVLNEEELIEPFVRHHAGQLDGHIVLDNGSSDRTLPILRALAEEGVALRVYQTASPVFAEPIYNTGLYQIALEAGADWVVFLDADELLDARAAGSLRRALARVPDPVACLQAPVLRHVAAVAGAADDIAFRRLTLREATPHMTKVIVRRLDPSRVEILGGQHLASLDGVATGGAAQEGICLRHFPDRSPLQSARKIILGRVKALASGEAASARFSVHYAADFEALKADPAGWLRAAAARPRVAAAGLVHDPAPYAGGTLRHTRAPDDLAQLIGVFTAQAEVLARSHGAILDGKRLIRTRLQREAAVARRLF